MFFFLKVIYESIVQALQQLMGNKLRSFLSSLGITIGIFCIISVLSAVDSLEDNIRSSFEKLGNDVVYVDRNPWDEDPGENWWKWNQRPYPSLTDMRVIKEQVSGAEAVNLNLYIPGKTIKYGASSVEGAYMVGVSDDYNDIFNLQFESGRFFTPFELSTGSNKVIMGYTLANELFPNQRFYGKEVKIWGRKFQITGVLEEEGNSLINLFNYDEALIIPMNTARKLVNINSNRHWGTLLSVKAKPGVELVDLRDEITGTLRAHRRIRPREDANFAINELSTLTNLITPIFTVMNLVGWCIGVFAIIVGMFSVANIMFVSVKERTNIIGIKKALGATQTVILLEFLIESIILCILGGVFGVLLVMGILKFISVVIEFEMYVSTFNIAVALGLALIIGVVSGFIPALQAARMDPVDAIRQ